MAQVVWDGFETGWSGNLASGHELINNASGTVTSDTAIKRSGDRSAKCNSAAGAAAWFEYAIANYATGDSAFFRGWFYVDSLPGSTVTIMSEGPWTLTLSSGGTLTWSPLTTGSSGNITGITTGTWYSVEITIASFNATTGAFTATVTLNGTTVLTSASCTAAAINRNTKFGWHTSPGASKNIYWDDIAINSAAGAAPTTAPNRNGKTVHLDVASISSRGSWTGGAGGTTLANMVTAISTHPPAGTAAETDTTQIESAASTTNTLTAVTESYTAAGLAAGDTVNRLQVLAVTGEDAAAGTKTASIRANGNPTDAGAFAIPSVGTGSLGTYPTGWQFNRSDAVVSPSPTLGTGVTIDLVDTDASSSVQSCCYLAAIVEYTPGAGGAAAQRYRSIMMVGD